MGVKCFSQEHNAMTPARARTRAALPGDERTNHEATAAPTVSTAFLLFFQILHWLSRLSSKKVENSST